MGRLLTRRVIKRALVKNFFFVLFSTENNNPISGELNSNQKSQEREEAS